MMMMTFNLKMKITYEIFGGFNKSNEIQCEFLVSKKDDEKQIMVTIVINSVCSNSDDAFMF